MTVYRLKSTIIGVEQSATRLHIREVAAGTILTVTNSVSRNGFVDARYCGRKVAIFAEDLKTRAEQVRILHNTA